MFTKKGKLLAVLVCMAIIIVTIFSALFINIEAHHDCSGHDCSICATLHRAEETIRSISITILKAVALAPILALHIFILLLVSKSSIPGETLVSQKVRLDN